MANIDFMELTERIRNELPETEFVAIHTRLCEEDGERLMQRLLDQETRFIIPACQEKKQQKLLAAGYQLAGVPMDSQHWVPVALGMETTDSAFEKIKAATGR